MSPNSPSDLFPSIQHVFWSWQINIPIDHSDHSAWDNRNSTSWRENEQNVINSRWNKLITALMGFEPMLSECQFHWKKKLWKEPVETTRPVTQTITSWFLYVKCQFFWENNLQKDDRKRNWTTMPDTWLPNHLAIGKMWKKMKNKVSNWFFAADLIQFLLLYPSETVTVGTVKNLQPQNTWTPSALGIISRSVQHILSPLFLRLLIYSL